jgi:hypothetical protein
MLKAAHIAVLTELVTKGQVGNGSRACSAMPRTVGEGALRRDQLPLRARPPGGRRGGRLQPHAGLGLQPLAGPRPRLDHGGGQGRSCARRPPTSTRPVLSYNLARGDENVFRSSKDGLIYYAQNAKEVLKTGVFVVVLEKVLTVLIWVVMLAPGLRHELLRPADGAVRVLHGVHHLVPPRRERPVRLPEAAVPDHGDDQVPHADPGSSPSTRPGTRASRAPATSSASSRTRPWPGEVRTGA